MTYGTLQVSHSLRTVRSTINWRFKSLLGVWKLLSFEIENRDTGQRLPRFGDAPRGRLILLSSGQMMGLLTGGGRCLPTSDLERVAAFQSMIAYSGTFRVEGDEWITTVDVSWNESWTSTEQRRYFQLEGDPWLLPRPGLKAHSSRERRQGAS